MTSNKCTGDFVFVNKFLRVLIFAFYSIHVGGVVISVNTEFSSDVLDKIQPYRVFTLTFLLSTWEYRY